MKIDKEPNQFQLSININSPQGNSSSTLNYDISYFVNLDSENKICFDCGGPFPTYVSINNGVFICLNCAINHSKLGYNISFIHKVSSPWDPYLLSYAVRGGNSRFKLLCAQYEVPCENYHQSDEEKLNKYIIRLGEYHRLLLRSEIMADEPPQPLYLEVAKNKCDLNVIYFPEFQNYQLYKGDIIVEKKNNNIGGKIWNGTKTTAGIVGTAGGMVYKVGKPVVCFLGKTAYSGLKYLGKSIYNHYYPENEKNNKINMSGNKIVNDNGNNGNNSFALVDYTDDDLKEIRTINLDNYNDNGNINNVNYINNFNNGNYNNYSNGINNKYNNYNVNGNEGNINIINNNIINNNDFNHNKYKYMNNHNNIIANDNYIINNNEQDNYDLYNKNSYNNSSMKNINNLNNNNNYSMDGFEIISNNNQEKEFSSSSNSLFDNNLYSGMNVEFENTDQKKARQDANNFLLKP